MSESSVVALVVSVVGVIATVLAACLTARMALRTDIERATILRFVEMLETTIQGLNVCIDHHAHQLAFCGAAPSKQNLLLRIQSFGESHKTYQEISKSTDLAMLKLGIYFPGQKSEMLDQRKLTVAEMALSEWMVKTEQRMKAEGRAVATDGEFSEYRPLEDRFVESLREAQAFLVSRRDHFIRCYALWREKNLSYIKNICPSANLIQ